MIDEAIRITAERRFRRMLWVVFGFLFLAAAGGAALAVANDDARDLHAYLVVVGLALGAAVIGMAVVLLVVYLVRRRGGPLSVTSPLYGVDRQTRRRIGQAVRTGQHLQGQEEELALDTAQRITHTRWLAWIFPVNSLIQVVLFVAGPDRSPLRVLATVIWVALGIATPTLTTRNIRRARAYLTPPPD